MAPAFYGHITDDIGWLCMAHRDRDGHFGPVDYIETDGLFLVLQDPEVRWARPHPYTRDGKRWGDPPLDAPSSVIYELCETDPPWNETLAFSTYLHAVARLDMALVGDDGAALFLDPGTGVVGFGFGLDDSGVFDVGSRRGPTPLNSLARMWTTTARTASWSIGTPLHDSAKHRSGQLTLRGA